MDLMPSKEFSLASRDDDKFFLRTISLQDIELLRTWKNDHRGSFFFKEIITQEMQNKWFQSYLQREHDFMMIVVYGNERIGCIGFRRLVDRIDIYNVILGQKDFSRKGHMANALNLVCKEAKRRYPDAPIMVSVLKTNPALQWYFRRGFVATAEYDEYFDLTLP